MKRVVLIGDSIRMGYQEIVRRELAGVAEVWAPAENGGNSRNVLQHLAGWALAVPPAVVHVNCGLHDLRREFGSAERAVPIEEYATNVREIMRRARESGAAVLWATTTPVNEAWHRARKGFDRFEADVSAYNEAALRVAREMTVTVVELYAHAMVVGRDRVLLPDGVHFTQEGYEGLGRAVAAALRPCLAGAPA